MGATKQQVREEALRNRAAIPFIERMHKSTRICDRVGVMLGELLPENRREKQPVVTMYSAMRSEVDLSELAHGILSHECRLCFPAMIKGSEDGRPSHMEFFEVNWNQLDDTGESFLTKPLKLYTREGLESEGFPYVSEDQIDVVITPVVAFDSENRRLGYGGGNYDRLFKLIRPEAIVIGVAFSEQEVAVVPTDEYDVTLPVIVHE